MVVLTQTKMVRNNEDECPEEEGLVEFNGCPILILTVWPIKMTNVRMNQAQGHKGCPWADSDGDGVTDNIDTCPDEAGLENNGCPELSNEVVQTINELATQINFAAVPTGYSKAVVESLNEIKTLLDNNLMVI